MHCKMPSLKIRIIWICSVKIKNKSFYEIFEKVLRAVPMKVSMHMNYISCEYYFSLPVKSIKVDGSLYFPVFPLSAAKFS